MYYNSVTARIGENREIAPAVFSMTLSGAPDCRNAAGRFLHLDCGGNFSLRRPISICDAAGDYVRLVYAVKGAGTRSLAAKTTGEALNVLGPLGNGYPDIPGKILLVGGGLGLPPLLLAAKKYGNCGLIASFRSRGSFILREEMSALCGQSDFIVDDGVAAPMGKPLQDAILRSIDDYDAVITCGPKPLMRTVVRAVGDKPCYVSLEERMACGVGACRVCVCATNGGHYARVCKDGPVFSAQEVAWDV